MKYYFRFKIFICFLTLLNQQSLLIAQLETQKCYKYMYSTIDGEPTVEENKRGTCSEGFGSRAYIETSVTSFNNDSRKIFKEVKPIYSQNFNCLKDRICYIAVQGTGLTKHDQLIILPSNQDECSLTNLSFSESHENHESHKNNNVPLLLTATKVLDLIYPNQTSIVTSFALFQLPERYEISDEKHSICYSPYLSKNSRNYEEKSDFHYTTGTIAVNDYVFDCTFEQEFQISDDFENPELPCGFKNYRDQYQIDLVWQLGQYKASTPDTGPWGDYTEKLNGSGHYLYMDSPGYSEGAYATIYSKPMAFSKGTYCVKFNYHMYGVDVSTLRVYIVKINFDKSKERSMFTLGLWNSPRWVAVGNKGDVWHIGGFDFISNDEDTMMLVFEALAGRSERSDIAIDNISIISGKCSPNIIHNYPKSYSSDSLINNSQLVCGEVRLLTGNYSYEKAWHVENAIGCAGKGYSMNFLSSASWVPCCVPYIGSYNVVMEDANGDGWNGSVLEFRFFNQISQFGGKDFTSGYKQIRKLIVGSTEILKVERLPNNNLLVFVRVVLSNSYLWCGVIKSGPQGQTLNAGLNANILKEFGIRSKTRSTINNQVLSVLIGGGNLESNAAYDLYCYAESTDIAPKESIVTAEIIASKMRVSTDNSPPNIQIIDAESTYNSIKLFLSVNESSQIWCSAEVTEPSIIDTSIYKLLTSNDPKDNEKGLKKIQENGTLIQISQSDETSTQASLSIGNLVANTKYRVFCFAMDASTPEPNQMSVEAVLAVMKYFSTAVKVPSIKIVKKVTETNGFQIQVQADAPGRVWCAATTLDYGVPKFSDLEELGVSANILNPAETLTLTIRGVEQNTVYKIYCASAIISKSGDIVTVSNEAEITKTAIEVTSYGRYCTIDIDDTVKIISEKTPFHPLTPHEELIVREFMQSRSELGLQGIYRITSFYNKTEIYDFYENNGPKPLRFARVRAGRCQGDVGYYEQFKVGPLEQPNEMTYVKLSRPVETACGGYNPQGVFGRSINESSISLEDLQRFFNVHFDLLFESDSCTDLNKAKCITMGPVLVEDNVEEYPDSVRIWLGFQTFNKTKLPFYIIYEDRIDNNEKNKISLLVQRLIASEHFMAFNSMKVYGFWFNEILHKTTSSLFESPNLKQRKLPDRMLQTVASRTPFLGAAGTAGPLPRRQKRRGDLEYKAPPEHIEPQGKRFTIEACETQEEFTIKYLGWSMTINNDRDTALKIYNLRFLNQRVAFEVGLMEALAHYTVSERNWYFLDSWYGGLGSAARKVHKGIECPKTGISLYFDGSLCVFEQDMARPIRAHWKSGEIRDGAPHLALVLRQMLTVSNYDYITDYVFHATGMFQSSISFTGELYAGIEVPWYSSRQEDYGVQVTGSMRFAALHSHMAVWKIDFDVGPGLNWQNNSVSITEVIPDENRYGALKLHRYVPEFETQAIYFANDTRPLTYTIIDERTQTYGNFGGYQINSNPGINPLNHDFELYQGPAAWAKYRVASSVFKPGELDSTLPRDNKFADKPAVSLDRYFQDDENIRNTDIVTWISDGLFHIPLVEDMPLTIPIGNSLGWLVKPSNLYFEDPSMDLHNSMGGGVDDPGTCAVVRLDIAEVEPTLQGVWKQKKILSTE